MPKWTQVLCGNTTDDTFCGGGLAYVQLNVHLEPHVVRQNLPQALAANTYAFSRCTALRLLPWYPLRPSGEQERYVLTTWCVNFIMRPAYGYLVLLYVFGHVRRRCRRSDGFGGIGHGRRHAHLCLLDFHGVPCSRVQEHCATKVLVRQRVYVHDVHCVLLYKQLDM